MGYRSDVRIMTTKDGYKELRKYINEYLKDNNISKDKCFNILNSPDIKLQNNKEICIGWNDIKWYWYPDIDAIDYGLDKLKENNYSYRFSRIGESLDDIEERYFTSEKNKKEEDLDFPSVERYFDDNYLKEIMDKNKNKEEVR